MVGEDAVCSISERKKGERVGETSGSAGRSHLWSGGISEEDLGRRRKGRAGDLPTVPELVSLRVRIQIHVHVSPKSTLLIPQAQEEDRSSFISPLSPFSGFPFKS